MSKILLLLFLVQICGCASMTKEEKIAASKKILKTSIQAALANRPEDIDQMFYVYKESEISFECKSERTQLCVYSSDQIRDALKYMYTQRQNCDLAVERKIYDPSNEIDGLHRPDRFNLK